MLDALQTSTSNFGIIRWRRTLNDQDFSPLKRAPVIRGFNIHSDIRYFFGGYHVTTHEATTTKVERTFEIGACIRRRPYFLDGLVAFETLLLGRES